MESKSKIYWTINVHNRSTLMVKYTAGTNYGYGLWSFYCSHLCSNAPANAHALRCARPAGYLHMQMQFMARPLCVCLFVGVRREICLWSIIMCWPKAVIGAHKGTVYFWEMWSVCACVLQCVRVTLVHKGCWLQGLSFTGGGRDGKTWQAAASIV